MNIQHTERFDFEKMGQQFQDMWAKTSQECRRKHGEPVFVTMNRCRILDECFDSLVSQLKELGFPHRVAEAWTDSYRGWFSRRIVDEQERIAEFLAILDREEHMSTKSLRWPGNRAQKATAPSSLAAGGTCVGTLRALTPEEHAAILQDCSGSKTLEALSAALRGQPVTKVLNLGIRSARVSHVAYGAEKVELTIEFALLAGAVTSESCDGQH